MSRQNFGKGSKFRKSVIKEYKESSFWCHLHGFPAQTCKKCEEVNRKAKDEPK